MYLRRHYQQLEINLVSGSEQILDILPLVLPLHLVANLVADFNALVVSLPCDSIFYQINRWKQG